MPNCWINAQNHNYSYKSKALNLSMEETQQIKKFVEDFFKNLKANISWQQNTLVVSEVPVSFEKFYGKKSPYKLVFEPLDKLADNEVVIKSSYLLNVISKYLEDSAKTTLLKIDFKADGEKEILKKLILKNCAIKRLAKKNKHKYFTRFTFQSIFQYLNEREQVIHQVYVHEGKVISGDLENYPVEEGNKREISVTNVERDYTTAKEKLKEILKEKTTQVADELNNRLQKEVDRIEKHYGQQLHESNELLNRNLDKLIQLENEWKNSSPTESEKIEDKIEKQKALIEELKEKSKGIEFEKEKENEIKSEKQKHSLNLGNKLINTTIIYYPVYTFDVFLENLNAGRVIEITFDPLTQRMTNLFCEVCENPMNEVYLCSGGHLSCKNCLEQCDSCHKVYCQKCMTQVCSICNKKVCKDCTVRCNKCHKFVCKNHSYKDPISGLIFCKNCLKLCERCEKYSDPSHFRISPSKGSEICDKCYREEINKKTLKGIFEE